MDLQIDRKTELKDVKRLTITTENGVEFRIHMCHLSGGIIINKYDDDSGMNIIPRVSNEILIK